MFNKYKDYFYYQPDYFFREMLDNNNFLNIKKLFELGFIFDKITYNYILSHVNSIEIILKLNENNIINKNYLFCNYYASKNDIKSFIKLHKNNFLLSDNILEIAIYNLSIDIIKYLIFEIKIEINEKSLLLLDFYKISGNIKQKQFSNYILQLIINNQLITN